MRSLRTGTCNECWCYTDVYLVDAGMFGEKDICHACYDTHYKPRPILEAPTVLAHGPLAAAGTRPYRPTGFDSFGTPIPFKEAR